MKKVELTSMERVLKALSFEEPDRVPLFLLLSIFGAKEAGMLPKKYFSVPENVIKTQLYMKEKYSNDCLYAFYYASLEIEAFGGTSIFFDDGPPNAGEPIIKSREEIFKLKPPKINISKPLKKVIQTIENLKFTVKNTVPIIGVVMSPFSLPVMQMGFDKYIELIYSDREAFWKLMEINQTFCIEWAKAQAVAGATAICYFDPVSSPSIIPRDIYLETGHIVAKQTIKSFNCPTAMHFASGMTEPIINEIIETTSAVIGVSSKEDISMLKEKTYGKISLLGNLDGISMARWDDSMANETVKVVIKNAAVGGGFLLSDNHGEIPFYVEKKTLLSIKEAIKYWGQYPIKYE